MQKIVRIKIKKILVILMMVIFSSTLIGCWDQKIYEKVGFILVVGIESSKEKHKKLLVTYTNPAIGLGKKNQVELTSQEADLLRQAREISRTKTSRPLEAGKIQQVLISKELAEKGEIHNLVSIFSSDPLSPTLAFLVIVDGSPYELCKKSLEFPDKPRIGMYLNQLLEAAVKDSKAAETRIYNFDTEYYAEGLDSIVPMIKLESTTVKLAGSALFSRDKMVGNIDVKQTTLMLAMMNKLKNTAEYIFRVPNIEEAHSGVRDGIAVSIKKIKRKINVTIDRGKPIVNIQLKFKGFIDEYRWDDLDKEKKYRELESQMAGELKNECLNIIKYTQAVGSDPLGIGDIVRAKHSDYWKKVDWKEAYRTAEINIDVKFELESHGLLY
ncbi:Ger(x)C family spore germination protein [Clostridium sp. OS1-26]|uniref:Ger(x)C family spore germination protein n=1 Tax=Clostridium sp. OS1-26 TaxID=3070681 RepID=UPI0027DEBB8C|nr:Ger(x)C family spore germination protein [Clostridium sp. OS1-26]WML35976.1 Ger(x)C family spore germination protein [Clostridium sp. OS1-26]